jgi:hypothetical protein
MSQKEHEVAAMAPACARPQRRATSARAVAALLAATLAACNGSEPGERDAAADPGTTPHPAAAEALPFDAAPEDSAVFARTMEWARGQNLEGQPIGEIAVRIAERFVGAPYVPNTLEVEGDERLIVNLRTFDCVTLVESALAMARLVRAGSDSFADFRRELQRLRYREGVVNGYISRLHYFSDWIGDNERRGLVQDVTAAIGGEPTNERIDFMSRNAGSYRQLADAAVLQSVREMEARVSGRQRHVIPQTRIAALADRIENGDVIAATSSIDGLDVAHTGFAFWRGGQLHLLHAPLVGTVVEISERPLAERIQRIATQDGIMVARPQ